MTKEKVEKRKAELQVQQTQMIANVNALGGAIQDCTYWIEYFTQEESQVPGQPATQ